jgi:hypothetical protein
MPCRPRSTAEAFSTTSFSVTPIRTTGGASTGSSATIPVASEDGENDFTLPPVAMSTPVDWNAMCGQQFPGSWATWIPGPATDATGAPWGCQAPAGVTYDPAENSSGVHAVTSG